MNGVCFGARPAVCFICRLAFCMSLQGHGFLHDNITWSGVGWQGINRPDGTGSWELGVGIKGKWKLLLVVTSPTHALCFPFLTRSALRSSTCSLRISCRSSFRRASNSTSSVVMVERPAWRLKLSRSTATDSSCVHTMSVSAPINCGVAFRVCLMDSLSTMSLTTDHNADLSYIVSTTIDSVSGHRLEQTDLLLVLTSHFVAKPVV